MLNDAYRELAAHYSAAVLPGKIRRPKDKASVENTVSHVATWVIAFRERPDSMCGSDPEGGISVSRTGEFQ